MKILFVIRDMIIGGAGKQLALTANALSERGHAVFVYTYFGGPLQHQLDEKVEYIAQNPVPKNKIAEYILSPIHIRKKIKEIKPDIAISWRCNAGCFTVLASLGLKVKTVFSERTDPYTETSFFLKISSFICGFSDGGVFQLEKVRQYYKRLYNKSIVIPNPIDKNIQIDSYIPYEDRSKHIVHVGRMMLPHKRQDLALVAFKEFLKDNPDYSLHFFGDGRDFEKVKMLTSQYGLNDYVVFHGSEKNIPDKMKNAKCLLLTSAYEGIPNVILEAFAAGVPVVSTDCSPGGARMLIGDDENGLIAKKDDVKSIAESVDKLVNDEKLAEIFIEKGRKRLHDFEPCKIFDKWDEFLRNETNVAT